MSFRKQTIIFLQKNILQIISKLESETTRTGDEFRSHLIYLFDVMIAEIDKTIGEGEEKENEREDDYVGVCNWNYMLPCHSLFKILKHSMQIENCIKHEWAPQ